MKTIVYVDGFNFYYGLLKYSPYKWLDIHKLFSEKIIREQNPNADVIKTKFFTADIKAKLASNGQVAQKSQADYHNALLRTNPDTVEIIKGYYSLDYAKLPVYKKPPDKKERVDVWKLEEKQTDVNMALHIFSDAVSCRAEQIVIASNDTDLEPPLQMIRAQLAEKIKIGIVIPIKKTTGGSRRPANERLSKYADWTRGHILEEELAYSQLPKMIATNKKPLRKPSYC